MSQQTTTAGGLNDTAMMLGDGGIDDLASVHLQGSERADFRQRPSVESTRRHRPPAPPPVAVPRAPRPRGTRSLIPAIKS